MGVRGPESACVFGRREKWEASLQDRERSSVASERVASLWEGDISQFTLGVGVCGGGVGSTCSHESGWEASTVSQKL